MIHSDSSVVSNSSSPSILQEKSFDAQDEEMLKILEELPSNNTETSVMGISSITADENRLTGYFCKRRINEPELRSDFGEFWRRM